MVKTKHNLREQWLQAAVAIMTPLFEKAGYKVPEKLRVSCGWPSRGGVGKKKRTLGQCWANEAASDKINQIFVSPVLNDPTGKQNVLDVLAHEVVHAVVGIDQRHNKVFTKCCRAIGLEGKPTSTYGGEEFFKQVTEWMKSLGPYPHGQLNGLVSADKKQSTRLVKCECKNCGYTVRTTRKWLEEVGAPICPALEGKTMHGPMHFKIEGLEFDGDDEEGGE